MILCLIFVIHKVIDWLKTPQILKQITLKSLEIAQKKSNIFVIEEPKILNNQKFNATLLNSKLLGISLIVASTLLALLLFKKSHEKVSIFFAYIILCVYHPFILFSCNKKLRRFVMK